MNAMGHDVPNTLGVNQEGLDDEIRELIPEYMAMGEKGMHEMVAHSKHMKGPENTLPMMGGDGPFGSVAMGGMFTVLKVRENITTYDDPEWFKNPPGTVADRIEGGVVSLPKAEQQEHGGKEHAGKEHAGESHGQESSHSMNHNTNE